MWATLRNRNFALLWFGGLISMAGDWMLRIALPVFVYQMTGSALYTSLMFIASTVPSIALGSVAGVFVDRWERKRTMVIANVLLMASLLPLLLVHSTDTLWIVFVVGFLESAISQFVGPAENAMLPTLVGEENLVPANALNSLNNSLARLFGPALGGFAVAAFSLSGVIVADAASYGLAALLIALITVRSQPERKEAAEHSAAGPFLKVWHEWVDGLRLIRRNRVVALLISVVSITAIGEGLFGSLFVVWIGHTLNGGASEIGWLMSAQAIGGLLGGAVIGAIGKRTVPALLMGVCSVLFGLLDILIVNAPVIWPSLWLLAGLFIVVGVPGAGFGAAWNTLFQTLVADEYRGRIFGAFGAIYSVLSLIGMGIAGLFGSDETVVPILNIQGGGYTLVGILVLLLIWPAVRGIQAAKAQAPTADPALT